MILQGNVVEAGNCGSYINPEYLPGKTPAKPSAFSISSSTGKAAIDSSLFCPNKALEGYIFVPIPKRRPVSFAIAS